MIRNSKINVARLAALMWYIGTSALGVGLGLATLGGGTRFYFIL
uniref:Uncharacterized protein n=1 Tax=Arundo donax TaxID=35708 RepID=A0A0A8Z5Z5_ARUDO